MSERWNEKQFVEKFPPRQVEWPITGLSDEGGLDCYKDTEVVGILVGNATVHDGVMFILRGMVTGKLTVEHGAIAYVHGIVVGNVTVNGAIAIYGMIWHAK
jgi:hypothetical protein